MRSCWLAGGFEFVFAKCVQMCAHLEAQALILKFVRLFPRLLVLLEVKITGRKLPIPQPCVLCSGYRWLYA